MNIEQQTRRVLTAVKGDSWSTRLRAEIDFLARLLAESGQESDSGEAVGESFSDALDELDVRMRSDGTVTQGSALAFEARMAEAGAVCKAYELVAIGHAHIDMNWMWGFHETVMVTVDTMRTVLGLLERYPAFHFSQSQASVYRIIEKYAPQLGDPIRDRIAEGRWEVTAGQWVESDMNLPSGESLARQMLYARRYLIDQFGAPEEAFSLVFLPDTFGHNANTPEILSAAGVRYLYHCRGAAGPHLSRWEAPSGSSVLVYREPRWYNTDITSEVASFLPRFAKETGLKSALCLYGVGDHGGGPTVRDIERLAEMDRWPLFPEVRFGTLRGYFDTVAPLSLAAPAVRGERNMIFTGCYSSQSRIKMANRTAERLLYEAELEAALAAAHCGPSPADGVVHENLTEGWTNTLFSHFHDILPGSGVQLTREYALGSFQETAAAALAASSESLRRLAAHLSAQAGAAAAAEPGAAPEAAGSVGRSEGGGVGFGAELFALPAVERGAGALRRYLLFNPLQWEREAPAEIVVWDWQGSVELLECRDATGRRLDHQVTSSGNDDYWGHTFVHLRVVARVPGFGFAAIDVGEGSDHQAASPFFPYGIDQWLVERPARTVLENDYLRAVFDPVSMNLASIEDRTTGAVVGYGGFRLVEEEAERMTAWVVGRYRSVTPFSASARIAESRVDPSLVEQWIIYESELPVSAGAQSSDRPASRLRVRVSLERGSRRLRYDVDCDWLEAGVAGRQVPQLQFALRMAVDGKGLRCDIPYGTIEREPQPLDVPANSFGAVLPETLQNPVVQLTSDSRQAFRFHDGTLSLTLLRSSVDPDPYPELGRHRISFTLSVLPSGAATDPAVCVREAIEICHPLKAMSLPGTGSGEDFGQKADLLSVAAEGCIVAAVKLAEPGRWMGARAPEHEQAASANTAPQTRLLVRLYETRGAQAEAVISLPGGGPITAARFVDLHERERGGGELRVEGGVVHAAVGAYQVASILIDL